MYDERFVTPMRQELTQLGVEEMRTPKQVDAKLKDAKGTRCRRQLCLRLRRAQCAPRCSEGDPARHETRHLTTVFAGQDVEAVQRARSYFTATLRAHRRSGCSRMASSSSCSSVIRSKAEPRMTSRRIWWARSTSTARRLQRPRARSAAFAR